MLRMATARFAAIALALFTCSVVAQEHPIGSLTVIVMDQTNAFIPGSHITATNETTGAQFASTAGPNGQAVVHLNEGKYALRVQAAGFKNWEEKNVDVNSETLRTITLVIDSLVPCGPCVEPEPVGFEQYGVSVDRQVLSAEIPLIPIQLFVPRAKPPLRRHHWFSSKPAA